MDVAVALSNAGVVTITPATAALTARWESATATTGRLVLEFNSNENILEFSKPSDRLGFKLQTIQSASLKTKLG